MGLGAALLASVLAAHGGAAAAAAPSTASVDLAAPAPALLTLEAVLEGLVARHPRIGAQAEGARAALGLAHAAVGHWDPVLAADGDWVASGLYPYRVIDASLSQATPLWGARLQAGWRLGVGDLPAYRGDAATASRGEAYAALAVPVLRGGAIDPRRADLRLTQRAAEAAASSRDDVTNRLRRDAAAAYWSWAAAAQQVAIEEGLLALAAARQASLAALVAHGEVPRIDEIENQRAIRQREERLQAALRRLFGSSIGLSLFWRDAAGEPQLAARAAAPASLPPPHAALVFDVERDLEVALAARPDLQVLEAKQRAADTSRELAENEVLPTLGIKVGVAREVAHPEEVKAALEVGAHFQMPLALRQGRGRAAASRAEVRRVALERRYLRDQMRAEVLDVHVLLTNTARRFGIIGEEVEVARQVEEAERERFRQGDSSQLIVNLREQARADAARRLVEVNADYWTAWSTYQAVLAQPAAAPAAVAR